MADAKTKKFTINSSNGSKMIGLPGSGGLNAVYLTPNITGTVSVKSDGSLYVQLDGTLTHPRVQATTGFNLVLFVSTHDFKITVPKLSSAKPSVSNATEYASWFQAHSGLKAFSTDVPSSNATKLGKPLDFEWEDTDGYIYIGGTGYGYSVNDPITTDATKIKIPGLKLLVDYFPGANRQSGAWWSCNRAAKAISKSSAAGYFRRKNSSEWVNRKNRDGDASKSTVFVKGSSAWEISKLIGKGSGE